MIIEGNIFKTLIFLSIPSIMMGIVQSLIPFMDGLFLNNLIGTQRTASINYAKPAIDLMMGVAIGLSVAAMAMIGQSVGRRDNERVKHICLQILVFSFGLGFLFIPINILSALLLSKSVDLTRSQDVFVYVALYSSVIPLQFMASIFNSIKNSTGNPESSLYRLLVLLILKVFFNYIFLSILQLDIIGSVLSSFCSYFFTTIWMYYDLFIAKGLYQLKLKDYYFDKSIIINLVRIGIPSMISFMLINLGFLLINMEVKNFGGVVLEGFGIAGIINGIIFTLPSSMSTSITTMISINIGNNQTKKAKRVYLIGMLISIIISIITILIILPTSTPLLRIFTREKEVLDLANIVLKIYAYSILPYSLFINSQAVLNALGRNVIPLIMGFLRVWLLRYIFILATKSKLGYGAVMYGNLFSNVVAAIVFIIIITQIKWKTGVKYE